MTLCPHCQRAKIGVFADELKWRRGTVKCRECGEESYRDLQPTHLNLPVHLVGAYMGSLWLPAAFLGQSWLLFFGPLVVFVVVVAWDFSIKKGRPLIPHAPEQVDGNESAI